MKKKKMAVPKSINESLDDYYKKTKAGLPKFAVYKMGEREGIARAKTIKDNPKAINRLRRQKKKAQNKNVGGFLETFSPAYSIAKGKGPIGEAVRGGKGMGILGMLASQADKGKKKASSDAMKADAMAGADRMSGGGKIVRSKRTRSIDGIATKGKTRGTQR
tara:strand:+ start:221 stop:706 length:486 start_codon:yes stop_codon:yes gene_type:complete